VGGKGKKKEHGSQVGAEGDVDTLRMESTAENEWEKSQGFLKRKSPTDFSGAPKVPQGGLRLTMATAIPSGRGGGKKGEKRVIPSGGGCKMKLSHHSGKKNNKGGGKREENGKSARQDPTL